MENILDPISSTGSSETINETDLKGSFGEDLDQQKSLVKQKEAELKEMQEQIESYNQMVKQLATQREMAVKKLAEMDTQIEELKNKLETERVQVEAKDKELKTKRTQLQTLKNEENELKEKFNIHKQELNLTSETLISNQTQENQIKTKLSELRQFLTLTNATIDDIEKAITIKDTIKLSALCGQMLNPPPLSINNLLTNGIKTSPQNRQQQQAETQLQSANFSDNPHDSFFDSSATFDPFAGDDPFNGDDPFRATESTITLPPDDPFNPSSATTSGFTLQQGHDPFAP